LTINAQIDQVLKKKSIMDFLESRGHQPVGNLGNGRFRFLCPFPDHKETRPSFVVFTQSGEYENFFCWGCSKGGTLIQLIAGLDGLNFRDVINNLGEGIMISTEEDLKFTLDNIKKTMSNCDPVYEFSQLMLKSSSQCLLFSQGVDFDDQEMIILDKYYSHIDGLMRETEFDEIEKCVAFLPSCLLRRKKKFEKRKKEEKFAKAQEDV